MNTTKETIHFFLHHVWRYKGHVIGILVTTPLAILFHTFLSSLIVASILERLARGDFTPNDLVASFGTAIALYTVVYLIGNVALYRLLTFLMWSLETKMHRDLAERTFQHLILIDATFHANHFGGALVAQASRLTSSYERLAYTTVYSAVPLILTFVFTIIILFPKVPAYIPVLFVLAGAYLGIALVSAKRIRRFNIPEAEASSLQTGRLADSITNAMTIKSFGREEYETKLFKKAIYKTTKARNNLMKATLQRDTYFSLVGSGFSIGAVVMVIIGIMYLKVDIATAFLMLTYSLAIARNLWDFSSKALRDYNRALGDAHEMIAILNQPPTITDPKNPVRSLGHVGAVNFNNISFTHDGSNKALFNNFNLAIAPGEKVGLVGRSGSGKTTLTKLLLRFNDVDAGEVSIAGQPITAIAQQTLRGTIAYVPQEPLLFHRSIAENIAYGKPNATASEIRKAARKANALEFIDELPDKFDTLVGERGIKLSGGQRQRIAIARAILKDAPILILDEATAALDSESEKLIQAALEKLMAGRTTIVVAHRLSTIAHLNRIIVLDKGHIVEEGTHATLLKKQGMYASLWSHQSGGFIEE